MHIISQEQFDRVALGQRSRSSEYAVKCEQAALPRKIAGRALLSGNLYCGHCGGKWEDLMLASVEGTCVFTPEQVKKRMDAAQGRLDALTDELRAQKARSADAERTAQEILQQHRRLLSWAELFSDASPDERKMVAANLIRAVRLSCGYDIGVEFGISEAQYLSGLEMGC